MHDQNTVPYQCRYVHSFNNNCNQTFNETLFGTEHGSHLSNVAFLILGSVAYVVVWPFLVYDFRCLPFGRVSAVLFGSLLMVLVGVVSQEEVFCLLGDRDNLQTLSLLLGMMLFAYYLERDGVLSYLLTPLMRKGRSFYAILWLLCLLSGGISALITNDAACVLLTPLILKEHVRQGRSPREYLPLLLAIATSANIGSAATVMGNPQNAYIAAKKNLNLAQTFLSLFPAAMLGLVINTLLLYAYTYLFYMRTFRRSKGKTGTERDSLVPKSFLELTATESFHPKKLPKKQQQQQQQSIEEEQQIVEEPPEEPIPKKLSPRDKCKKAFFSSLVLLFMVLTVVLLSVPTNPYLTFDLGLVPVGCAACLMLIDGVVNGESGARAVRHIDWGVILLFCGLFVWLGGFKKTNIPKAVFLALKPIMRTDQLSGILVLTLFLIVGSNLLSNVPMVFLVVDYMECLPGFGSPVVSSLLLAWVATIAGNFTLFGSVANLIVAEKAKRHIGYSLGFLSYLMFGLFSTFVVLFVGLPIVYYLGQVASLIK